VSPLILTLTVFNQIYSAFHSTPQIGCYWIENGLNSASARISKGQGYHYQVFLRKRAGSSFGQKGQFASFYKEKLEKWTEFHYFYCQ
jgi:hypothetical protein